MRCGDRRGGQPQCKQHTGKQGRRERRQLQRVAVQPGSRAQRVGELLRSADGGARRMPRRGLRIHQGRCGECRRMRS